MQWLYPAGAWALLSLAGHYRPVSAQAPKRAEDRAEPAAVAKAAADQSRVAPFQKLKKNILYFLQLLLALLLTAL